MTETPKTCTVRTAVGGVCGKPAVYVERSKSMGEFAECAEHAADPYSLRNTRHMVRSTPASYQVGDKVMVERYGKKYVATVVYVGKRGRVEAEFTYNNGTKRRVAI